MTRYATPELCQVRVDGTTRATFLARATLAAGALVGAGAISPFVSGALAQGGGGDVEILNYALTLEHLEAAFYRQAAQASGLSEEVAELVARFGGHEEEHVEALQGTIRQLGGTPVAAPGVDFGALGGQASILKLANAFEDTGVSAYNGAAPMIESKDVLRAAGSIVQVEARHAALIRLQRDKPPAPRTFDKASSKKAVLAAVAPYLRG